VFPEARILLCNWHVKRNWLKHLLAKVRDPQRRLDIFLDLTDLMMGIGLDTTVAEDPAVMEAGTADELLLGDVKRLLDEFVVKWEPWEPSFIGYFKQQWLDRAGVLNWPYRLQCACSGYVLSSWRSWCTLSS
jgi:hypothetical protein